MSEPADPEFEELNVHVSTMTAAAAVTLKLPGFESKADASSVAVVISALLVTPYQEPGLLAENGAPRTYEKRGFGVRLVLKATKAAIDSTASLGGLAAKGSLSRGDVTARLQGLGLPDDLLISADKAIGDFTGSELLSLRKLFNESLPDYIDSKERQPLLLDTYSIPGPAGSGSETPHRTVHFAIRQLAEGADTDTALQRLHPSADDADTSREIIRQVYLRYGAGESGAPPDDAVARAKAWLRAVQIDD